MNTHYETLGVPRSATKDEIRSAYIVKARKEHPDAGGTSDSFNAVHKAYETLGRGDLRKQYDAWLDEHFTPCLHCSGRGVIIKTKSFKERTLRPCLDCRGSGVGGSKL